MKSYLLTLLVGLCVGLIYGFVKVRSPAPPVIALVGLLGILAGEQAVPWIQKLWTGRSVTAKDIQADCEAHMFAQLPGTERARHPESGDRQV